MRRADMTPPPFDTTHDAVRSSQRTAPAWTTLTAVAVLAATLVLSTTRLTAWHTWGDDFAGYLLQAKALSEGTARAEVALNGQLVDSSDRRVGPDGYPWGVPALPAGLAACAAAVLWQAPLLGELDIIGSDLPFFGAFVAAPSFALPALRADHSEPSATRVARRAG